MQINSYCTLWNELRCGLRSPSSKKYISAVIRPVIMRVLQNTSAYNILFIMKNNIARISQDSDISIIRDFTKRLRKGIAGACVQWSHLFEQCNFGHWRHDTTLQWRNNGLESVSNHQPCHCSLSRLLGRISRKTSKLRVTGLCAGNSPVPDEFPAQMASYAEMVPFDVVIMIFFE